MRKVSRAKRTSLKRISSGGVVLALVALFGLPTAAFAANPSQVVISQTTDPEDTATVNTTAGINNIITVAGSSTLTFKDTGSGDMDLGAGAAAAGCVQSSNANQVNCPSTSIAFIHVNAGTGDDRVTILTTAAVSTLNGGDGDDLLIGSDTDNVINGDAGNDTLTGREGSDDLHGGADTDLADYDYADDACSLNVTVGDGNANDGFVDSDCNDANGVVGEGDEVFDDVENVDGGAGIDTLTGTDNLTVGNKLQGGPGDDTLNGGAGPDTLDGQAGADALNGGLGTDTVSYGQESTPVLVTVDGVANDGQDTDPLTAGIQPEGDNVGLDIEVVIGGLGADDLTGGAGSQTISGGNGNDTVNGDVGTDTLNGGNGVDTISYAARAQNLTISLDGAANDGALGENDNVAADFENVLGGDGDDTITGSAGVNRLDGGLGADTLNGGAGNDVLVGSIDGDVDTYNGDANADTVTFGSDAVGVVIEADGSGAGNTEGEVVATTVERLTGGSGPDTLTGNSSGNTLNGGNGDDSLFGLAGSDTLNGGLGNDDLHGQDGNDALNGGAGPTLGSDNDLLSGGANIDTVSYSTRTANLNLTVAAGADDGQGVETDNIQGDVEKVTGGKADDFIRGDAGADTLTGGAGNDNIGGNGGADVISGQAGNDILTGGTGKDSLSGADGGDIFHTQDGVKDSLNCGAGNDDISDTDGIDAKAANCTP